MEERLKKMEICLKENDIFEMKIKRKKKKHQSMIFSFSKQKSISDNEKLDQKQNIQHSKLGSNFTSS